MKGPCMICGEEIEIVMCCNGFECGCQGGPSEPPVCSQKCYDAMKDKMEDEKDSEPVYLDLGDELDF